jgi:dihydrolipoamide dehydrogenase
MVDVFIIGGGPGGYSCAIRASQLGLKVALVEKEHLGGVCLNRGCIPTKTLSHTAEVLTWVRKGSEIGINSENVTFDLQKAMSKKDRVTAKLRAGTGYLMKKNGVDVHLGTARIINAGRVEVTDATGKSEVYETKNIVIATGSSPITPGVFGFDGERVITSNEMLALKEVPEALLVIGAGVIGCEFASIFSTFGSKVTLVDVMPRILPMVDEEASLLITASFRKRGMEVVTGIGVKSVEKKDGKVTATLDDGRALTVDKLLLSIGRRANGDAAGIKEAGIEIGFNSGRNMRREYCRGQ